MRAQTKIITAVSGVLTRTSVRLILLTAPLVAALPGVSEPSPAAEPLAVDTAMEAWAATAVGERGPARRRLAALDGALAERGWSHRDDLTLPAAEAFARAEGDCVSFAFVLAALARSRGVPVVLVLSQPETADRQRDLSVGRGHLAVGVEARRGFHVFDAGGARPDAAAFRAITDRQAVALYHSNRGSALLLAARPAEAVGELRQATRIAPEFAVAWSNLGVALLRSGDAAAAEQAYRRAVALAPESAGAWRNLAQLLERRLAHHPATVTGKEPL